ncbi:glycosyltransferase [Desulfosarcina ovata]|uniref:glycosyltransferase n=1 Tax=Desulfosarcina ovata TaxID=83564 RepID=UPI0012D33D69|nr:glycosyltransferase family A protein [Desulfosarcina ovata]
MYQEKCIDIIIPCYNESEIINLTLGSIKDLFKNVPFKYNVVVVDNGSTDNSMEIVEKNNVSVVMKTECSVAEVRNYGAGLLKGQYIVFLDADVLITKRWMNELIKFVESNTKKYIITGSPVNVSSNQSLLEKCWFSGRRIGSNYINSGNLIVTRSLFEKINGFDPKLITGEDYDFCVRAINFGSIIKINPNFYTIHYGFPTKLYDFFKREMWHGIGDFQDYQAFFSSKPAILATFNSIFLLVTLIGYLFFKNFYLLIAYSMFITCVTFVISKHRSHLISCIPYNMIVSFVYLVARFASLWKAIASINKKSIQRSRNNAGCS